MLDHTLEFHRRLNLMFALATDVEHTARDLDRMAFDLKLLAMNGVAQAANTPGDGRRPMTAMTAFLTRLPLEIRPELDALENHCRDLTARAAECSQVMTVHLQLVRSLEHLNRRLVSSNADAERQNFLSARVIRTAEAKLSGACEAVERASITTVANSAVGKLGSIDRILLDTLRVIRRIHDQIHALRQIERTARYVSIYLELEASKLINNNTGLLNLAAKVRVTSDALGVQLDSLGRSTSDGEHAIEVMALEVQSS